MDNYFNYKDPIRVHYYQVQPMIIKFGKRDTQPCATPTSHFPPRLGKFKLFKFTKTSIEGFRHHCKHFYPLYPPPLPPAHTHTTTTILKKNVLDSEFIMFCPCTLRLRYCNHSHN